MANQQLNNYIKREYELGKNKKEVEKILLDAGWHKDAIADAFKDVSNGPVTQVKKDAPKVKAKKPHYTLIGIIGVLVGVLLATAGFIFFQLDIQKNTPQQKADTGFEAQKNSDGQRIADLLKIQSALEEYYKVSKAYPDLLDKLSDIPKSPSGSSYAYTPIGNPPQSYTLNAQMENVQSADAKVKDGFLTLKNQQGKK